MRTYTVTRKKGSKLGKVFYSVGTFSFHFKTKTNKFTGVPEVIAVRVSVDYKDDFDVKIEVENAEPDEVLLLDPSFNDEKEEN